MEPFFQEVTNVLFWAALHPAAQADWILAGLSWAVGAVLGLKLMAPILNNANESWGIDLFMAALTGAVAAGAAAAAAVWLMPVTGGIVWLPAVAAGVAILLAVAPLFRMMQRVSYLSAVSALLVMAAMAAVLHLGVRTAADSIRAGRDRILNEESRQNEVNQMLE